VVSVIVPYNTDRGYLHTCLSSIRAQGVDVEVIESQSDHSVAYNFNRGLERANGEYVKFVCEDDFLPRGALRHALDGIADWVFGDALMIYGKDAKLWTPADADPDFMSLDVNLRRNCINGGATLYRTDIVREVGGMDESLWTAEEYDMNLRLWIAGHIPNYVNKPLYAYRMWHGQKYKKLNRERNEQRKKEIRRIQALHTDAVQQRRI